MAAHWDGSDSPKGRVHWHTDEGLPGYPYSMVVNSWHATPTAHQCLRPLVNPLVRECICPLLIFLQSYLQTHISGCVASVGTHSGMPKIGMCMADAQHQLASSSIMHMGTNQKAQQSWRGSTSWGVSSIPRLFLNTWACVSEHVLWITHN